MDQVVRSDTQNNGKESSGDHQQCTDSLAELTQYEPYVKPGFFGMFQSKYVVICAFVVRLGGFLFGYDQGVVSIILTTDQFINVYPRISDNAPSGAFWKGFLTALLQLGAVIGAFNQGWIADKISRKRSITLAACIFVVGSAMQTGSSDYVLLVGESPAAGCMVRW